MKIIVSIIILLLIGSCKPKPEFWIDGKPYYTITHCEKSHIESEYGYGWGYNMLSGKFEHHWGIHDQTICDEYKTDTILITE
jgi:hypothetical protein